MSNYFEDNNLEDSAENSYAMNNVLQGEEEMPQNKATSPEAGYMQRQAQAVKERGVNFAKQKVKDTGKKIIAKAGKKVAQKAGKAVAKAGAKIAAKRGAQAALGATGIGAIGSVAIEAVDWGKKALAWAGKQFGLNIGWKHIIIAAFLILNIVPIIVFSTIIILVLVVILGICKVPGASLIMGDMCGALGM